jgi:hypothetical protein
LKSKLVLLGTLLHEYTSTIIYKVNSIINSLIQTSVYVPDSDSTKKGKIQENSDIVKNNIRDSFKDSVKRTVFSTSDGSDTIGANGESNEKVTDLFIDLLFNIKDSHIQVVQKKIIIEEETYSMNPLTIDNKVSQLTINLLRDTTIRNLFSFRHMRESIQAVDVKPIHPYKIWHPGFLYRYKGKNNR